MASAPLLSPPPMRSATVTRSPTLRSVTPAPSLATTPDGSTPSTSGSLTGRAYFPARTLVSSVRLTETAWTLSSTSPGPGSGVGTSSSFMTPGGPNSRITMAFNATSQRTTMLLAGDKAAACRAGQATGEHRSALRLHRARMGGEQRWQPRRIAARHAAFGADAVDAGVTAGGSKPCLIAVRVVVVNEAEIKFGLGTELQSLQRRVVRVVGPRLD